MILTVGASKGADNDNRRRDALTGGAAKERRGESLDIAPEKSNYGSTGDVLCYTKDSGNGQAQVAFCH